MQSFAIERVPSLLKDLLRRGFQQGLDDAGAQLDAGEVGAGAELAEEESQAARPVALLVGALVRAQGIAGPGERPVGVELAEDVVLVSAGESGGEPGDVNGITSGIRLPVRPEGGVSEVGDEPHGGQWL